MILKILGIMDIITAICFWIFGIFRLSEISGFILLMGLVLLVKGVIFIIQASIASILDIVCALLIIASTSITMPNLVIIIVALFLIQKGIFSMLS